MRPVERGNAAHCKRKHANQAIELCPARVQAFYGRSAPNPQLRYVEVAEHVTTLTAPETDDFTKFGIPANVQFSTHPTQLNDSL
ncbi:hypothetical protein V1523DRAFT_418340 [Lipomyces doorenjongii]